MSDDPVIPSPEEHVRFLERESQRSAVAAALAELAARSTLGIVVLTADGTIAAANDVARRLFAEGVLPAEDGALAIDRAPGKLGEGLRDLLEGRRRGPVFVGIPRPGSERPMPVALQRSRGGTVTVYVGDLDPPIPSVVQRLQHQYELTYTEARVAARLAGGVGVPEVAADLGVQESTVRTHLKRIFQKTGTNRQSELVRLVVGLPVR